MSTPVSERRHCKKGSGWAIPLVVIQRSPRGSTLAAPYSLIRSLLHSPQTCSVVDDQHMPADERHATLHCVDGGLVAPPHNVFAAVIEIGTGVLEVAAVDRHNWREASRCNPQFGSFRHVHLTLRLLLELLKFELHLYARVFVAVSTL